MAQVHWTEESLEDYLFSVRYDFVYQLEKEKDRQGLSDKDYADIVGVGKSRISQILNNKENITLKLMIRMARALGLKLSVAAYDDGDSENNEGPIPADVFRECWERLGKPKDFHQLRIGTHTAVNTTMLPIDSSLIRKQCTSVITTGADATYVRDIADYGQFQRVSGNSYQA